MRGTVLLTAFAVVVVGALTTVAQRGPAPAQLPGYLGDGVTLLPNGWKIAPEGRHVQVGDLPMAMVPSPDGRFIAVTTSGYDKPAISIFDTRTLLVVARLSMEHTWLGLVWHPDGTRLFASGSSENAIYEFTWRDGKLAPAGTISLGEPERHPGGDVIDNAGFVAGMTISADGRRLYETELYGERVRSIDLETRQIDRTAELPAEPYTCMLSPDGRTLYVSVWGGAKVIAFDAITLERRAVIDVGEHPNAMAISRDGSRLFVACANTNSVWAIDLASRTAAEQISVALYPDAPAGSTPNALALAPDGRTLAIANADNNTVTLVQLSAAGGTQVKGWIPVGWYPTGVLFSRDGTRLFVTDGKGVSGSAPNLRGPQPGGYRTSGQYSGAMFEGAISTIPVPTEGSLQRMSARVRELTPYSDAHRLAPANAPGASPIPRRVGDSSPIKHVFYVIRENRTYDQILGDVAKANGDPTLTLFGEDVTPNAHALVNQFAIFDNFYVDAEVSYDGHAFSTGAYATDFVEKMWPANYGRREGLYLSEGGYKIRNAFGNIAAPAQGYLWDSAKRAGVSVRSYGEFAFSRGGGPVAATVPGLDGFVNPEYPPFNLRIPDVRRIEIWRREFEQFEKDDTLPRLSIIRLGNDHTSGTTPGALSPRSLVADNDIALGQLVETISKSRYWKDSAIFVVEDDAQNGPDHVDAHRSVLLAISPFVRRGVVDSTLYTTSGVLRTIELILGIPPMSQYDAAATPMYNAFQPTPDAAGYTVLPARVPLDERNDWSSPGAAESARMDLSEADLAPDLLLNQIIWQAVRGKGSVMPPPRRTGFIRPIAGDDDDDDR
jgi:DNA-binding beta-propeller fold protein YncE